MITKDDIVSKLTARVQVLEHEAGQLQQKNDRQIIMIRMRDMEIDQQGQLIATLKRQLEEAERELMATPAEREQWQQQAVRAAVAAAERREARLQGYDGPPCHRCGQRKTISNTAAGQWACEGCGARDRSEGVVDLEKE